MEPGVLDVFPDTVVIDRSEVSVGGISCSALADRFGTPLIVYCERTLRARARAYRRFAPRAFTAYSVKACPNVALIQMFADEGLGANVSTLGELAFAQRAGLPGDQLIFHGNNKSDGELEAAADGGVRFVVIDSLEEIERAALAGVRRVLIRVTLGVEADTHEAIKTGHAASKFGLSPDQALRAIESGRDHELDVVGLHVHTGSQLLELDATRWTIRRLAAFASHCRSRLGWTPSVVDLGGGLGIGHVPDEYAPTIEDFATSLLDWTEREWRHHGLPRPRLMLEPGRSLVGPAGLTLYRVGAVKRTDEATVHVAVDGGMSDNPRPQLYGARYAAVLASRADEPPVGRFKLVGKHCESGDVLADGVELPEPRRGDLLAVPATGAYTLAMSSNYNVVPRPAAVMVNDGDARVIRRRESIQDLLASEEPGPALEARVEARPA